MVVASGPVVERARRLAATVLAPAAEATDQAARVPPGHLAALADAGLYGLVGPADHGGLGAPAAVVRTVQETLAAACGVTSFTWNQHHSAVKALTATSNVALRDGLLGPLCAGTTRAGVAFAYLRRPGTPAVAARRVDGGWIVDGEAPWVTAWGMADVFLTAARAGDDVVWFLLPGEEGDGVRSSPPLALLAMSASRTVRVTLQGVRIADDRVVDVEPYSAWAARDRLAAGHILPAALGAAAAAIRLLGPEGATLEAERVQGREAVYTIADRAVVAARDGAVDVDDLVAALVRARAWTLDLAGRAATAAVVAAGGAAMDRGHPAQRLLREVAFYLIQAQTPALRRAMLDGLTAEGSELLAEQAEGRR